METKAKKKQNNPKYKDLQLHCRAILIALGVFDEYSALMAGDKLAAFLWEICNAGK